MDEITKEQAIQDAAKVLGDAFKEAVLKDMKARGAEEVDELGEEMTKVLVLLSRSTSCLMIVARPNEKDRRKVDGQAVFIGACSVEHMTSIIDRCDQVANEMRISVLQKTLGPLQSLLGDDLIGRLKKEMAAVISKAEKEKEEEKSGPEKPGEPG